MNKIIFKSPRAKLTIEHSSSRSLGRCYSESTYRVTSTSPLKPLTIEAFRAAGLLGTGQEFLSFQVLPDGRRVPLSEQQEPSGTDLVEGLEVDEFTGKPTGSAPLNPYTGKPYPPHSFSYFIYECVTRCDSGD
jgi:hypothetical protein